MGQPHYVAGLATRSPNPADDRPRALRGRADRDLALRQWQALAEFLAEHGFDVLAIAADKKCPDLVIAGAAGFLPDRSARTLLADKTFYIATLASARQDLQRHFQRVLRGIGFETDTLPGRFAGAADFFRCGKRYFFTPGDVDTTTNPVARLAGIGRKAVWGSDRRLREDLTDLVPGRQVLQLGLADPRYSCGSQVAAAVGEDRKILMVYDKAFDEDARQQIIAGKSRVADYIIPVSREDAALYACSVFQFTDPTTSKRTVLIPKGVSDELLNRLDAVGVSPLPIDVSEWIKKDRGGIAGLIADLGWIRDDRRTLLPQIIDFRRAIRFRASAIPEGPA